MRLAHELEAEANSAFDLWTWLPSYKAAQAAHGDYASEFMPDNADIMREAAMRFSEFAGFTHTDAEVEEWYGCPCQACDHAKGRRPDVGVKDEKAK